MHVKEDPQGIILSLVPCHLYIELYIQLLLSLGTFQTMVRLNAKSISFTLINIFSTKRVF